MLSGPRWLALEVKYLDRAQSFYETFLDLEPRVEGDDELRLAAGETDLVLRSPSTVPRGGLHTHYALSTPPAAYDDWWERLDERFDLVEHQFGDARSLYFYDPDGNCVEIGERAVEDDDGAPAERGITGVFEVVLEVTDLDLAVEFYERLGFEVVDSGADRKRVRLTVGDFDLELWEPHLGLADGRGGVHVDLGIGADDPQSRADAVSSLAESVTELDDRVADSESTDRGILIRDPDGHYVTLVA